MSKKDDSEKEKIRQNRAKIAKKNKPKLNSYLSFYSVDIMFD